MKKYLFIIAILVCGPLMLKAQENKSRFVFNSDDPDAHVSINGSVFRKVPAEFNLGRGTYFVIAKESMRKWNPRIITDSLKVTGVGSDSTITVDFGQEINLDSRPQNAEITSGGQVLGYTPMKFISSIPAVMLRKKNYESVKLPAGGLNMTEPVEMKFTGVINRDDFFESDLFKLLLGSAAALGATAAYFKIQADNKYNDYLKSKNPSILDEVDRLDLYSGIALGILQVNFGYLIYKFLSN